MDGLGDAVWESRRHFECVLLGWIATPCQPLRLASRILRKRLFLEFYASLLLGFAQLGATFTWSEQVCHSLLAHLLLVGTWFNMGVVVVFKIGQRCGVGACMAITQENASQPLYLLWTNFRRSKNPSRQFVKVARTGADLDSCSWANLGNHGFVIRQGCRPEKAQDPVSRIFVQEPLQTFLKQKTFCKIRFRPGCPEGRRRPMRRWPMGWGKGKG